jgi:inward rectifier potassium channel
MADQIKALPSRAAVEVEQDLGFGRVLTEKHNYRLLNRDGSFNVRTAQGIDLRRFVSYHTFLSISWPVFFAIFGSGYIALNAIFALLYMAAGPSALQGDLSAGSFLRAFFFSVHTFATVGYGSISPETVTANVIVTAETLVGLMAFALVTGLIFARFSRPVADIRYSNCAVIAPYFDISAFEFRMVNARRNQLLNLEATVLMGRFEGEGANRKRKFHQLKLERPRVAFFPLNWTVVHPIDDSSPLYGWTKEMLLTAEAEVFVVVTAVDETFAQTVNSRTSYTAREIQCGRRFVPMYEQVDQVMVLDLEKLSATEPADLPACK